MCCNAGRHHQSACHRGDMHRFQRRFCTAEEKIACLEEYMKQLEAETEAVKEHLEDLRRKK